MSKVAVVPGAINRSLGAVVNNGIAAAAPGKEPPPPPPQALTSKTLNQTTNNRSNFPAKLFFSTMFMIILDQFLFCSLHRK
jgi:hypothetical protein